MKGSLGPFFFVLFSIRMNDYILSYRSCKTIIERGEILLSSILTKEQANFIADSIMYYVYLLENLIIFDNDSVDREVYEDAIKTIKKKMKKVRKRKDLEEIFDLEELTSYLPMLDRQIEEMRNEKGVFPRE